MFVIKDISTNDATIFYDKNYLDSLGLEYFEVETIPDGHGMLKTDGKTLWWEEILPKKPTTDQIEQKIIKSKTDLQNYLANHPLQWTDGNYYTITEQKQNQLTRAFAVYEIDTALGLNPVLEWNDTDEKCREWTKEELSLLASAINQRVRPLVKYQQAKEVEIRNAQTLEELESIVVNYDEVV